MRALVVAALLAAPAAAETFEVGAATSALLAVETPVYFRNGPKGLAPDVLASATSSFAVVDAKLEGDAWKWTVLPLSTGSYRFTARWNAPDGKALEAETPPIQVKDLDLGEDADILDIKPLAKARPPLWPLLLAAALGALGFWGYRKWKDRALPGMEPEPPPPPRPAEDVAREAIAALAASGLWEKDAAAYYLRLTDILRAYLESRYGEPATAMTSAEVARLVKDRAGDLKTSSAVRELLTRADLVKFAKAKPGATEGPEDAKSALGVVDATTPRRGPERVR